MISIRISDNLFLAQYTMLNYSQSNIANVTLDSVEKTVRKGLEKLASLREVAESTIYDHIGRQMEGNFSDWCSLLYDHIIKRAYGNRSQTDFQNMLYIHTTLANYTDECNAIALL